MNREGKKDGEEGGREKRQVEEGKKLVSQNEEKREKR